MSKLGPGPKATVTVAAVVVVVLVLFTISAAVLGPWWRWDFMPTPEEWSAFFGASALVALAFAWYQIRQLDQSNKALIASNELAREANLETVRPRVFVGLESDRFVAKNRGAPTGGTVYIVVTNSGLSRALDVALEVDRGFDSLDQFFKPGMKSAHFAEVNATFDGTVRFQNLAPGMKYIWFLGRAPELFDAGDAVPRRYEVTATYKSPTGERYSDRHVIDLDVEKRIALPVDPLLRIGKDIEVVGDKLEAIKRALPK